MANKLTGFFKEVQGELSRVTWPSRDELFGSAVVVITLTFLLAGFIGVIDFVLSLIIRLIVRQ